MLDDPALGDGASAALRLLATAPQLAIAQETADAVHAMVSLARADAREKRPAIGASYVRLRKPTPRRLSGLNQPEP